jgi:MFS family permease
LVTQSAERRMRGLFLAIRHSAVPAAAALIGRVLPPLMLLIGWRAGVLSLSAALLVAVAFTLIARPLFRLGGAGRARVEAGASSPWTALRARFQVPRHLRFLWGAGLVFAVTQTSVTFFSYLYLLEVIGLGPIAAGIFASNLHLTALIGRPVLGWLCDRTGSAQTVLAGIAMITVVTVLTLLAFGPDSPGWLLVPLAMACGVSGQCWNSVFVTAMSFKVEDADLAEMNGRAFSFLSLGWMSSAPVFWGLIEVSGGYEAPFLFVAAINVVVAGVLLFGGERR